MKPSLAGNSEYPKEGTWASRTPSQACGAKPSRSSPLPVGGGGTRSWCSALLRKLYLSGSAPAGHDSEITWPPLSLTTSTSLRRGAPTDYERREGSIASRVAGLQGCSKQSSFVPRVPWPRCSASRSRARQRCCCGSQGVAFTRAVAVYTSDLQGGYGIVGSLSAAAPWCGDTLVRARDGHPRLRLGAGGHPFGGAGGGLDHRISYLGGVGRRLDCRGAGHTAGRPNNFGGLFESHERWEAGGRHLKRKVVHELPRTPSGRSSRKAPSTRFGE